MFDNVTLNSSRPGGSTPASGGSSYTARKQPRFAGNGTISQMSLASHTAVAHVVCEDQDRPDHTPKVGMIIMTTARAICEFNCYPCSRWSTPLRCYRHANSLFIPTEGDPIWHLPKGEFQYI